MPDVRGAGVDVHCFPLLIASSRAAVCAPFGFRVAPENEAETMTCSCICAAASAARVRVAHCYFVVNNNDAGPRARPRGVGSRALEPRSVRLGQTKNAFGDRALTDTEAAFSLARNGAGVPAIARIVTCFLRRARSRAAPQQAPKHAR